MIYLYLILAFAAGYLFNSYRNVGLTLKSYVLGFLHCATNDMSIISKLPKEILAEMGIGIKNVPAPLRVVKDDKKGTD